VLTQREKDAERKRKSREAKRQAIKEPLDASSSSAHGISSPLGNSSSSRSTRSVHGSKDTLNGMLVRI